MEKHEQRDAVRASFLMVPDHEVYRTRTPPPEEDHHRGGELHENEPCVMDDDHGEW